MACKDEGLQWAKLTAIMRSRRLYSGMKEPFHNGRKLSLSSRAATSVWISSVDTAEMNPNFRQKELALLYFMGTLLPFLARVEVSALLSTHIVSPTKRSNLPDSRTFP
jgi:hypothetical protein